MDLLFGMSGNQTITILRKGATDEHGDTIDGNEFGESHTISNVLVQWDDAMNSGAGSDHFQQDQTVYGGVFMLPVGSDILPTDIVELEGGDKVRISGRPSTTAFGLVSGVAVRFRGVT